MKLEKKKESRIKKDHIYIGIIIILIIVIATSFLSVGQPSAALTVKNLYDIRTGNADIISTEEISGLYKVTLTVTDEVGGKSVQDVYVTKDGNYILSTNSLVSTTEFESTLKNEKNYTQCLSDNNVVIFGAATDSNSALQLQTLGVNNFITKIFYDCSANLQACQQLGVTVVPSTSIGNNLYTGLQTSGFITEQTGCSLR
jgi:protein-disulfide isomerase